MSRFGTLEFPSENIGSTRLKLFHVHCEMISGSEASAMGLCTIHAHEDVAILTKVNGNVVIRTVFTENIRRSFSHV